MRFELTVALKYLIPRWRQLSVSIISLLSILVISLVVWLVVLFLSVTEGIERKWIEELVAFNAPIKMTPTDAYFRSYYHLIDSYSAEANYTAKTIGEKLLASKTDPYDPQFDSELPLNLPAPDLDSEGKLKDPVKEAWAAVQSLSDPKIKAEEYEVTFGNLHLNLFHNENQSHISQVSYISAFDSESPWIQKMLLYPKPGDYQNLLRTLLSNEMDEAENAFQQNLTSFFNHLDIKKVQTTPGFVLGPSLYPVQGTLKGVGIIRNGLLSSVILPETKDKLGSLERRMKDEGLTTRLLNLEFQNGKLQPLILDGSHLENFKIYLDAHIPFKAKLVESSLKNSDTLESLQFVIASTVQDIVLYGTVHFKRLEITEIESKSQETEENVPLWVYQKEGKAHIPTDNFLGEGILISKNFQKNGVQLGDRGVLSYYSPSASSVQEQRVSVYVAGFYDPGMLPLGNKLIFVDPKITALFRSNLTISDQMLGNGINVWMDSLDKALAVKERLIHILKEKGISQYWKVESFHDYEFSKPILQQLKSDRNLFTIIAIIILIVACSNIISMLILLVNDKRKEIGIMASMGASSGRIAFIFGICGFATGLVSSIIGTIGALLTLRYLQNLIDILSFLQGHEVFHAAFYGQKLPNQLSYDALSLVVIATLLISILAGIIPAIKASRIRPSEILRSE